MKLHVLLAVGLFAGLAAQQPSDQREGAGGIIFGPGFAFALGAPQGWIFDTRSAQIIGSRVVMYPVDTDLTTTDVWIAANAFPLNELSIKDWIEQDIADLKAEFPGIKVTSHPDMFTADSLLARVRGFSPAESGYELTERIAYIKLGENVAVISLSARSQKTLEESLDAFDYVVSGFSDFKKELERQSTGEHP